MKLFYFQAKRDLNKKDKTIILLKQANAAMVEELKEANLKLEKRKRKKVNDEQKGNGDINTVL